MNDWMIEAWNSTVGRTDRVFVLGDFGYRDSKPGCRPLSEIFEALTGRKHLIVGNHDEKNRDVLKLGWETQTHLGTVRDEGRKAVVCHYPLETWKYPQRYAMLHGHSHGTLKRKMPRRQDVGVDVIGYEPIEFIPLVDRLMSTDFVATDHHGD